MIVEHVIPQQDVSNALVIRVAFLILNEICRMKKIMPFEMSLEALVGEKDTSVGVVHKGAKLKVNALLFENSFPNCQRNTAES